MTNEPLIKPIVTINDIASPTPPGYKTATGTIRYGFTNDFMFRSVLEANPLALKGLICSMLHLQPEEICSITIKNPFMLGESVADKDSIMDIRILLNNQTYINLEMQIATETFWPERSLTYLCKSFLNLQKGESYSKVRPAIHIGFLDYDLFPEAPEFYATYHMANDVTHQIYTGKFTLSVLSLNQAELATEEDKKYDIDYWAKLFKATTWEELRMIAEHNPHLEEAAKTVYQMSDDEQIRELCFAREEHQRIMTGYIEEVEEAKAALAAKETELVDTQDKLADTQNKLADALNEIKRLKKQLQQPKN